jgi:ParB-like chromosome segregation protein Spo0J
MSFELEVRYMQTESVMPNPLCTRRYFKKPISKVGRIICENDFMAPIIIDEINTIIVGQYRWEAAREIGLEVILVYQAKHLSKAQKKAFRLEDNRLALDTDWDDDPLRVELELLLCTEIGID